MDVVTTVQNTLESLMRSKKKTYGRLESELRWLRKHNPSQEDIKVALRGARGWIKSFNHILIALAYGYEFYVSFRGASYFLSPDFHNFVIIAPDNKILYETDDLDDFGENARIGENGEFYLKTSSKNSIGERIGAAWYCRSPRRRQTERKPNPRLTSETRLIK